MPRGAPRPAPAMTTPQDRKAQAEGGAAQKTKTDDSPLLPLAKMIMHKNKGVKKKEASEVGRKKVQYIRGVDFERYVLRQGEVIQRRCVRALDLFVPDGKATGPTTSEQVAKLGTALMQHGFMKPAEDSPIPGMPSGGKWPGRVKAVPERVFNKKRFYIITWVEDDSWNRVYSILVVVVVLAVCMWSAWPEFLKKGGWLLMIVLVSAYFGLELCRMSGFTTFWIIGYEFWILPNLNDEYLGVADSFRPLYSFERRRDSPFMILTRILILALIAMSCEQISRSHSLSDLNDFITTSYADVYDWGVDRFIALPEGSSAKAALPSMADIERMTAEDEEEDAKEAEDENIEEEVVVDEK